MINSTIHTQETTLRGPMEDDDAEEILGFSAEFDTFPVVLAIFIVLLNSFVLYLVVRVKSLRTLTNFILGSLALTDFLNGVLGIPLYLACSAIQSSVVCGITQVLTKFFSISIVLHLLLVSIDRHIVVVHAMRYRSLVTKRRVFYLLLSAWATAIFVALIQLSWIGFDVDVNQDSEMKTQRINTIYNSVCIALFFAVPLVSMAYCYLRIFIVLRQQLRSIEQNNTPHPEKAERLSNKRKRRAAFIFISMIVMYIICWLPYFMLDFQHEFGDRFFTLPISLEYALFYYPKFLNSLLNPLLFVLCKHDFRQAIRTLRGKAEERSISLSLQNTLGKGSPAPSTLTLRSLRYQGQLPMRESHLSRT